MLKQVMRLRKKLSMVMYLRGQWKGDKNPRYLQPLNGNLNGNWKGGITGIYYELRSETKRLAIKL